MSPVPRPLAISNREPRLACPEADLARWFVALDFWDGPKPPEGEISLVFLSDMELAHLHGVYLDDPSPTDVITFPGDPDMGFAGEICVSAERAAVECTRQETTYAQELALYLVHGWLHLAGFGDLTEQDRPKMRTAEQEAQAFLNERVPLPGFAWKGESPVFSAE